MKISKIIKLSGAVPLSLGLAFNAVADVNLSGKKVEWTIPFSESGGSAKWANFFAPLLSEALPGNPTVTPRFMPGAGSTKGANWFQKQRNGDGTVMFGSSGSTQFPYLLDDPRVQYEYKDWEPVMASGTGGVAYLPADLARKFDGSANQLKGTDFIFGSQGATRLDIVPLMAFNMLGLTVDPVFGIKGRGDGRLMFERGEANIDYQTSSSYLSGVVPLVNEGKAVPMMTWGALDANGNITRDPTFPEIATFKEVCQATAGCKTSGPAWNAWKAFFVSGFSVQKIAFLPQGTSQEIVDTFTNAFQKVLDRPDFAEISATRLGKYPVFIGADAKKALQGAITVSDSAKAYVKKWLKDDYGVDLQAR